MMIIDLARLAEFATRPAGFKRCSVIEQGDAPMTDATTYEIEIGLQSTNYRLIYVDARTEAEALRKARKHMTQTERRWADVILTGRNR
jgi:hypothetical protein